MRQSTKQRLADDEARLAAAEARALLGVLMAGLAAGKETAYKMLIGKVKVTLNGKYRLVTLSEWEKIAGDLSVILTAMVGDYRHEANFDAYASRLESPVRLARADDANLLDRIIALRLIIQVWHLRNIGDDVDSRTFDAVKQRYMSNDEATELLQTLLNRYITEKMKAAVRWRDRREAAVRAFWKIYWLRVAVRRTGEKPTDGRDVPPEFMDYIQVTWTDPDGWADLVTQFIDEPTLADFGLPDHPVSGYNFEYTLTQALEAKDRVTAKMLAAYLTAGTVTTDSASARAIKDLAYGTREGGSS